MSKKVFVSYASKDKWVRDWLVAQLEAYGVEVLADYKTFHTGKASLVNIEESIQAADYTFFVLSKQWFESEWTTLENYIVQTLSPANRDMRYFFLRLDDHPLPLRIKPFTYLDMTDAAMQEAQLKRLLTQLGISWAQHTTVGPKPEHISLHRLPDTSGLLFGRESQLALLDAAWENPNTHIVAFVAQGGEGKTALCRNWVNTLAGQQFRGAERVYAWSFYSQGSTEDRQASSGMFIADALTWWGDAAMANSPASAVDKARRLAALIRQARTLLILDGVEPLQYPPGEPHHGKLRDEALRVLLKELASHNNGLCLVSTRVHIRELDSFKSSGMVLQAHLPRLDKAAGAALLVELGVKGTRKDLEATAEEYHGHALALTLLGNLLREYCAGDVRRRDTIPSLQEEDQWGGHARRVLAAYVNLFSSGGKTTFLQRLLGGGKKTKHQPELEILRILGLFDRPAEPAAVAALLQGKAILGITTQVAGLGTFEYQKACRRLRELGILEKEKERLDCHPLVREYFAGELQRGHKEAWTEAHRRLYVYYTDSAKELPDTLEEMEPLFRAMGHGCKAGLYQEALDEVYWKRIDRGKEGYSTKKLGAFNEDLAAIAGLFERPWEQVVGGLSEGDRAFLLNEAGFCLRALGRLREAAGPMLAGLEMDIARQDWKSAAAVAGNLSELRLMIGELGLAVTDGRQAVALADQSGDEFQRFGTRTTLADALQQAGEVVEAEGLFREAEALQLKWQPAYPRLYSLRGYRFCALQLAKGEWEEVKERAQYALEISQENRWLLDISLDQLSLGRAAHLQALGEGAGDFGAAKGWLDQAVEGLRKAGTTELLPLGLLARAALLRDAGDYAAAETDLQEVEEIARGGEMRLHLCDYHLEMVHLCLAVGSRVGEAEGHYQEARRLVEETGYHRRDGELAELRVKLDSISTQAPRSTSLPSELEASNKIPLSDTPSSIVENTTMGTPVSPIPPSPALPPLDDLASVLEFNKNNLERLSEQLTRPTKVIPFVGAGMSAAYGFKGWWGYLMHHAQEFGVADKVEHLLADGKYEEAAQELLAAMLDHAFHAALEDEYGPRKLKSFAPNPVSKMIPLLTAGPVITTNYDQVLERTFESAGKSFHRVALGAQVDAAAKAIEQQRNVLLKLHGDAEERTNRILTLDEYRQHYGDVDNGGFNPTLPLPKVLARVMSATPLFFLGCSLEVDRTMKVLAAISQSIGHGGHYAILPLPKDPAQMPTRKRQLSEHHIFPIWYDASKGHGMVGEILGHLVGTGGPQGGKAQEAAAEASEEPPPIVSTDHLPHTSGQVFGRDAELQYMAAAWEDPEVRVLTYVAQGGEGKTALLQAFLNQMADQGYRGARRVFAWSFYSQGAATDSQANSAEFLRELLVWLGESEWIKDPNHSDYAKAGRIVKLLRAERTLLILDGVEPLQYPPNTPHGGELKDRALHSLLRGLAHDQPGLCVVTTRLKIANLTVLEGRGAVQRELPPLLPAAGAQVLQALGVKGSKTNLQTASEDLLGHALSLTLLGTLLVRYYEGDVQKRDRIPKLMQERQLGAHAQHILQDYVRWLDGLPALQVLRLMGLFDRPVELGVVKALAQPPAIAGITEHLVALSDADWRAAILDLRQLHLIGRDRALEVTQVAVPQKLDCHPLVREYFARELQRGRADAWTEAHRRLYEHYKGSAKYFPDTLEEMEPLFRALGHGCKAGLHQKVLDEVYWNRIHREDEGYSIHKLGAFSEELAAIVGLFERPWEQVAGRLGESEQAFLLNQAGFCLRALGRLREAVEPLAAGLEIQVARQVWKNAAVAASNLSEVWLVIGELGRAVAYGRRALDLADQSGHEFKSMGMRTTLADALLHAGEVKDAEALLREAEDLQRNIELPNSRLYSLWGHRLCALLLVKGEWKEVKDQAQYALEISQSRGWLLDIALDQLSLGRAAHLQAQAEGAGDFGAAKGWLDEAVEGLRKSGYMEFLPLGLLARAALLRDAGDYPAAETDLQEVEEIAGGEMRLHLCDYHLEMARLCLAVGGRAGEAEEHYKEARRLVEETGYHRRDGELAELRGALGLG